MQLHNPLNPTTGLEDPTQLPWTTGVPATGQEGSFFGWQQIVEPMTETVNALKAASLTPTSNDLTQLTQAMSIGLWLGAMSGTANAITDALPTLALTSDGVTPYAIPSLQPGMTFHGIIPATNTGPATLALTGFGTAPGAKPIVRKDGTPVQAGDQIANSIVSWRYDGTSFRIVGMVASDVLALISATAKTRLSGATTFYVNSQTGSDTNPGTQAAPFLTIQAAVNYAQRNLDLNGYTLTFNCAGSFTAGASVLGLFSGQTGVGAVVFSLGTSSITSAANCFTASGGGMFVVTGTGTLSSTGTGSGQGNVFTASAGGQIQFSGVTFGACGVGHTFATGTGSSVLAIGPYTIGGSAPYHISSLLGANSGYGSTFTVTIANTPAFSQAFAVVGIQAYLGFNGVVFSGSATGNSLSQDVLSNVYYGASGAQTTLPGNGTVTTVPLPVVNGGTGYAGAALTSYQPTLTATSGSSVSFGTPSGTYLKVGKLLYFRVLFQVSYASAPGAVLVTLPTSLILSGIVAMSGVNFSNNAALAVTGSGSNNYVNVTKYDGTTPAPSSGNYCVIEGWVEVQ